VLRLLRFELLHTDGVGEISGNPFAIVLRQGISDLEELPVGWRDGAGYAFRRLDAGKPAAWVPVLLGLEQV
jgi:hypothetical protein